MSRARPLEVKIYDLEEFDKDSLEKALKLLEGKAEIIYLDELEEEG